MIWLFDLDNTLYPPRAGLMDVLDGRIRGYMTTRAHIPLGEAERVRRGYCAGYGTCLTGLQRNYAVDADDFLTAIHDFDVTRYLAPDPALCEFLNVLAAPKFIFTNAPAEYARRVLQALGVEHHFERIFDIRFLNFVGKPNPRAYCRVLDALDMRGRCCVMVEDSPRNLRPAKVLGMRTILRGNGRGRADWIDVVTRHWRGLQQILETEELLQYRKTHFGI